MSGTVAPGSAALENRPAVIPARPRTQLSLPENIDKTQRQSKRK